MELGGRHGTTVTGVVSAEREHIPNSRVASCVENFDAIAMPPTYEAPSSCHTYAGKRSLCSHYMDERPALPGAH